MFKTNLVLIAIIFLILVVNVTFYVEINTLQHVFKDKKYSFTTTYILLISQFQFISNSKLSDSYISV